MRLVAVCVWIEVKGLNGEELLGWSKDHLVVLVLMFCQELLLLLLL